MIRAIISASLAGLIGLAMISEASAWSRSSTVTTARGTYSRQATGGCAGGTCSHYSTTTGPYGGTVSRSGSVTQTAPGSYDYSRTMTGPNGGTVTRSGTVTRY